MKQTYPTTGYTPETPELTKLRNEVKACIEIIRDARSGGDQQTSSYWECRLMYTKRKYNELRFGKAESFQMGSNGDALTIRKKVAELRYLLAGKKREIAKTTKLSMLTMMQKDVAYYEGEIARLTALLPTGFAFRDVVDRHMNTLKGA